MPQEISAGVVIFRKEKNRIKYLLLHYGTKQHPKHWGFVKGHIEAWEDEKETVLRETDEETGLIDLVFIEGFREKLDYFFRRKTEKGTETVHKVVVYYLAETKTKEVKISFEHIGYKWLEYKKALEKLTFDNSKEILRKADGFLKKIMNNE